MGVTLSGPAYVLGYNTGVVNGALITEWGITKKHIGIFYHAVYEASAQGILRVVFIKVKHNI